MSRWGLYFLTAFCKWTCVFQRVCRTKAERQSEVRIRGSEIMGGREGENVGFLTRQGHPECDWKSPVCLGCLPHEIMQTGCSADNITVLTTPPFLQLLFQAPSEKAGMQECHSHTHTQTSGGRDTHCRHCRTCDFNTRRRAH